MFCAGESLGMHFNLYSLTEQSYFVVGILPKNTSSSVDVMRVEKAPEETYADIGGLDDQIMEIKVC